MRQIERCTRGLRQGQGLGDTSPLCRTTVRGGMRTRLNLPCSDQLVPAPTNNGITLGMNHHRKTKSFGDLHHIQRAMADHLETVVGQIDLHGRYPGFGGSLQLGNGPVVELGDDQMHAVVSDHLSLRTLESVAQDPRDGHTPVLRRKRYNRGCSTMDRRS